MSPLLLLALLGVTFPLPGVQELLCQFGTLKEVWNVSQLPLHWTPKEISCDSGLGCQDTLVLIESGPQVSLVLSKGCTEAKDQEPRVTEHRMGPGLSVLSYTYVCRHKDFCNNLVTTAPLWTPQPPAGACPRVGGEGGAVRRGSGEHRGAVMESLPPSLAVLPLAGSIPPLPAPWPPPHPFPFPSLSTQS
uniref:CD177 antigen n=1 Tax=Macaca fascicularis TaxID=9541 RepID=A0A2K5VCV0_MACFA